MSIYAPTLKFRDKYADTFDAFHKKLKVRKCDKEGPI